MALFIYNFLMLTLLLTCFPLILPFLVTSRKRRSTFLHRLGLSAGLAPRPEQGARAGRKTIWIHALSLGEVVSAVPLVSALAKIYGRENLVFSASTLTGFETARHRLKPHVRRVFYFPYDILFSVVRVVDRIAPDLVIIVETDLWPNFMARLQARRIPVLLANARLSDRSTTGYRRLKVIMRPLLNTFAVVCVQSAQDAARFISLGAHPGRVRVAGNLKFDQRMDPPGEQAVETLRQTFHLAADDRVLVAGSTHPGEEEILLRAFTLLRGQVADVKLVVAPRNPDRATAVKACFSAGGFNAGCLAVVEKGIAPEPVDVVVIDRIGVLAGAYGLGDLAFVGGSLVKAGGHNPLEPAAQGKPVLFGPDMSDFREAARLLVAAGGAIPVTGADNLAARAGRLLSHADLLRTTGRQARQVFADNAGAVERTVAQVLKIAG